MNKYHFVSIFLLIFVSSVVSEAQRTLTLENTVLTEREVAIGLDVPWEMKWGPDDHIWFTERAGKMKRMHPGTGNVQTILDMTQSVGNISESGMLGFCFHPDFKTNNKVFLAYDTGTNRNNLRKTISTFTWNGTELTDEVILLDGLSTYEYHSGCRMMVSKDEKLLVTIGDRFDPERSLELQDLHGKLLRMELDGSIPSDNPFTANYVYAYGLRNSQGLGYGPHGGLFVSDHGRRDSDEINRIEPGANYGWPEVEGACDSPDEIDYCQNNAVVTPLMEWSPCIAVSDFISYDHPAIPEWEKTMLVTAMGGRFANANSIRVLSFNETDTDVIGEEFYFDDYGRIRDVCINPHNGAIFFATNGESYPSSGPNRIIEYRNLLYTSVADYDNDETQFVKAFPTILEKGDNLNVSFSDNFMSKTLEIFGMDGVKVGEQLLVTDTYVNTNALDAGQYFVMASNENGTITQKFVIVE